LFVAFTIGANDETMTPAVGAGLLSLSAAVIVGGVFNLIGVFFLGESVAKTVGNNFTYPEFPLTLPMVFIILISMAAWLLIVSMKGIPISTTQSIVGSVLGIAILIVLVLGFTMGWDKIAPWLSRDNVDNIVNPEIIFFY